MSVKQYPDSVISEKRTYTHRKAPETKRRPFCRAYRKLSTDDKLIARDLIMKRGKITTIQQFNDLKLGHEPINIDRYDLITSIFQAYYLDAWTGETTKTLSHDH
ncbi:MAG: hypothetical protein WCJ95_09630 [Mariniphaga sp.]